MKLYTAIIKEIQEQAQFSAYQITTSLRQKTNSNLLTMEDVPQTTLPNGDIVSEISHNEVNSIIREIYEEKIVSLKRESGNGYFIYKTDDVSTTKTQTATTPTASSPNLETKITLYIKNKKKSNEAVTLRRIHSALKRKGIKINDISSLCIKLGYKIVPKTPTYKSEIE